MRCQIHNLNWEISDPRGCPVCYGYEPANQDLIAEINTITEEESK